MALNLRVCAHMRMCVCAHMRMCVCACVDLYQYTQCDKTGFLVAQHILMSQKYLLRTQTETLYLYNMCTYTLVH